MKKKLILIVMALALVINITACGTNKPNDNALENENNVEETNDEKDVEKDTEKTKEQIEYELTEKGRALQSSMDEIQKWAEKWN